jgi:1-phosphofructokinase family hexose kinase
MIITLCPNPSVDKILQVKNFHLGQVNKCTSGQSFPGGKGVHVAMALKELGNDSKIIGFFGGPTGEWIREECTKMGISCLGPNLIQWTRTCITMLTNSEANNTEILENGPKIDTKALDEFFGVTRSEISDAEAICVSGSWPVNSPEYVYERLKSICDLHHKELWVDASGKRLEQALQVEPFGIHINKKEAAEFYGHGFTPIEYTQKLLDKCTVVALTDGSNGLFLGYKNRIAHGKCSVKNIISTVGSGDCLTAGLIHAWYQEESFENICKTATACGAANCVRPELGMIYRKDVVQFKKNVQLKLYEA